MTLPELADLNAYWSRNPRSGIMLQVIARLLGWKWQAPEREPTNVISFEEAAAKDDHMYRGLSRWFPNMAKR